MEYSGVARIVYLGSRHTPTWFRENFSQLPQIKTGEVLVKIRLATICSKDLKILSGEHKVQLPVVLGHEAVCEVIEDRRLDEKCTKISVDFPVKTEQHVCPLKSGTRLIFASSVCCNDCPSCRLGFLDTCSRSFQYGEASIADGHGFNGCFATHMILRKNTLIIPIPSSISDKMAVTVNCSLALIINAVAEAKTTSTNETAVVQGADIHGLYACAVLKHKGYKRVICCDKRKHRLKSVKQFGGEPCFSSLLDVCPGVADCLITMCEEPFDIRSGLSALRCGGISVFVGISTTDLNFSIPGEELIRKSVVMKGVRGYLPRHLHEAVQFLQIVKDNFPFEDLISSRTYQLDEFEKAFHMATSKTFHRVAIHPL